MPHHKFSQMSGMPAHMVPKTGIDHDGHRTAMGVTNQELNQFIEEERHEKDAYGRPMHPSLQRMK